MKGAIRKALFAALFIPGFIPAMADCTELNKKKHGLNIGKEWGEAEFSQYDAVNETSQWRYNRKGATLIVARTEGVPCEEFSQADIAEYNEQENMSAILVLNQKKPAVLRLYRSDKGVNLRTFQTCSDQVHYEVQLGINDSVPGELSFQMEREFFRMINGFSPAAR